MADRAAAFVIMFTTVVSGLMASIVICVPVVVSAFEPYTFPDAVKDWGGVIVGFYFGSFTTFMLEYMKGAKDSRSTSPSQSDGTPEQDKGPP